jgi:hypothetical protein
MERESTKREENGRKLKRKGERERKRDIYREKKV